MQASVRRQSHRLAESLFGAVRQHRSRNQRIQPANAPLVTALDDRRLDVGVSSFASGVMAFVGTAVQAGPTKVIQRLRIQSRAERVDNEDGGVLETGGIERARGMRVVMIDDTDALSRILQPQLEVIVFELPVAGTAVQPARDAGVIGVDEVDLLERFQTESLQAIVDATEGEVIRVLG